MEGSGRYCWSLIGNRETLTRTPSQVDPLNGCADLRYAYRMSRPSSDYMLRLSGIPGVIWSRQRSFHPAPVSSPASQDHFHIIFSGFSRSPAWSLLFSVLFS